MIKKIVSVIALLVIGLFIGIAVGVTLIKSTGPSVGGTVETFPTWFTSGVQIGSSAVSPPIMAKLLEGRANCAYASSTVSTITQNSSITVDCPVTGTRGGDITLVELASTTVNGIYSPYSYSSSTANYLEVVLYNSSSTAALSMTGATSSVEYIITR